MTDMRCPHCGVKQYSDNPHTDPALASMASLCWRCLKPLADASPDDDTASKPPPSR